MREPDPTPDEDLYDAYLEALLQGDVPDPQQFAAEHGGGSDELVDHLRSMTRSVLRQSAPPSSGDFALPFERLGEFRIEERIGAGGMGVVYRAVHESSGKRVAVKVLHAEQSHSARAIERLRREARAVARLQHPHLVSLETCGEHEGIHFLAMEFVEGRSLHERLAEARPDGLAPEQVVRWGARLARALHSAHELGVIHRDVKPSNVLLALNDEPKLVDFGLARTADATHSMTRGFVGSPAYMAPEQIAATGSEVDVRTDVYGLGVTLYQCLTGRLPFEGAQPEATFRAILEDAVPPLRRWNSAIPRDVEHVVLQAMARRPADRYQTAEALAEDLEALVELRPVRARPMPLTRRAMEWARRHRATTAVLGTAILGAVILFAFFSWDAARERRQQQLEARQLLESVRKSVEESTRKYVDEIALEEEIDRYHATRFSSHTSRERDAWLDRHERDAQRSQEQRELATLELLSQLSEAARLGAAEADVRRERARIFYAKVVESRLRRDPVKAELFAERVRQDDIEGEFHARLDGLFDVQWDGVPSDVEVHLFRFASLGRLIPDGEPRLVPVPSGSRALPIDGAPWALHVIRGVDGLRPGDLVLELAAQPIRGSVFVEQTVGELRRGDRLISIDDVVVRDVVQVSRLEEKGGARQYEFQRGDHSWRVECEEARAAGLRFVGSADLAEGGAVRASVWRDGSRDELDLPAGLKVRPTAAPLYLGPDSRLGTGPIESVRLEVGHHLFVFRPPHGAPHRRVVRMSAMHEPVQRLTLDLHRPAAIPEGFVRVCDAMDQIDPFWIHERETTLAEYLEFLNDPGVNAQIPQGGAVTRLVPRDPQNAHRGGHLRRLENGQFVLDSRHSPDLPAFGLSWNDAEAYVEWLNARPESVQCGLTYALPTRNQHDAAGLGILRRFVYGDVFRHKWASTCFAREIASPEPVMGFPIDESVFGVYDLTGSVAEFLLHWEVDGVTRRVSGGSWGTGGPEDLFHASSGVGVVPTSFSNTFGFRLVVETSAEDGD